MKEEQTQHHHQYDGGGDMTDLRQFFYTGHTHNLPPPASHQSLFSSAPLPHHCDDVSMMLAMGGHATSGGGGNIVNRFRSASTPTNTTSGSFNGGGAAARWPRQETLTLLEVRTRLDYKFKEANHKGPLWDELSRIMCEEHGYQRSGKKCREKFENLYKYYKKTKHGKVGKHDGKHYRFFRQLEALYGEASHTNGHNITNNSTIHIATNEEGQCNIISNQDSFQRTCLSNFSPSEFVDTSSSEAKEEGSTEQGESSMDVMVWSMNNRRRIWKEKMKECIGSQMRKMMEMQEAWLENTMRTLEHKEQERMSREEEWRKQETKRMESEHKVWAEERAWIEARDKALMAAVQRIIASKEVVVVEKKLSSDDHSCHDHHRKQKQSQPEEEESVVEKAKACNNKDYCSKKRKVNCRSKSTNCSFQTSNHHFRNNLYKHVEMNTQGGMRLGPQEKGLGSMNESCLRMLLGDGGDQNYLWDQSYEVNKLNKGETR